MKSSFLVLQDVAAPERSIVKLDSVVNKTWDDIARAPYLVGELAVGHREKMIDKSRSGNEIVPLGGTGAFCNLCGEASGEHGCDQRHGKSSDEVHISGSVIIFGQSDGYLLQ